ncbi:MD-2-related lipid-recognition [Panus rudis PR-1116 ss-1]|nr:MD-2-related lipid-recognition [Panus rudis PR-1116 ss-1]
MQEPLPTITSDRWKWTDCGSPSDPIRIKSIDISPDPPKPGEDLTVKVKGVANQRVEEGAYADVTVKVGVIKILQKEFDLCEEARNAETSVQCPVEEGEYTVTHTVTLPKEIPPAPFKVDVNGYTVDDEDLVCLQLEIDFRKRPGQLLW